ncbi:tRNA-dependent cyclodipeptide synthase [Streptomyces laurentii]|uniref:tRNA-dependent cyclodipeptide synthase n=1 Tax=Streptomyces laurentii TaxID=39478 RepID=UPI0036B923D1
MSQFDVLPATAMCRRILKRGDHVLIGVSTGNSYFNQERLGALLVWAERHFSLVDVIYVDTHIDTMLMARGLTPDEARRRTKSMLKDVRRRIRRALERVAGAEPERFRVGALSEYVTLPAYQEVLRRADPDLGGDGLLVRAAEEQVRDLLMSQAESPPASVSAAEWDAGLAYLRAELPFLLDTPAILGVPSSVACYHKSMPVVRELFQGLGSLDRNPRQGFLVVRPPASLTPAFPAPAPLAPESPAGPRPAPVRPRRTPVTLTAQYDEIAPDYTDVERVFSTYRSLVEVPSLLHALGPVEGASVLDIGCGTGAYARMLRQQGAAQVLGTDLSPGMVDTARRLEEADPLGVRYEVHDAADMPVLGAFDVAVAVAVLHYADSRETLARMLRRVRANLAAGGRFLAYVGNPRLPSGTAQMNGLVVNRPDDPRDGDPSPLTIPTTPPTTLPARYWSCETIEAALGETGFGQVVWEPMKGIPPSAGEPVNLLLSARVAEPVEV